MTMMRSEDFLSVRQVAVELDVSTDTVYRLIRTDGLRAARRGTGRGRLVVPRTEIERYFASLADAAAKRRGNRRRSA